MNRRVDNWDRSKCIKKGYRKVLLRRGSVYSFKREIISLLYPLKMWPKKVNCINTKGE